MDFIGIGRWEKRPESAFAAGLAFGFVLWLLLAAIAALVIVVLASVTSVISGGTGALIIGAVVGWGVLHNNSSHSRGDDKCEPGEGGNWRGRITASAGITDRVEGEAGNKPQERVRRASRGLTDVR